MKIVIYLTKIKGYLSLTNVVAILTIVLPLLMTIFPQSNVIKGMSEIFSYCIEANASTIPVGDSSITINDNNTTTNNDNISSKEDNDAAAKADKAEHSKNLKKQLIIVTAVTIIGVIMFYFDIVDERNVPSINILLTNLATASTVYFMGKENVIYEREKQRKLNTDKSKDTSDELTPNEPPYED